MREESKLSLARWMKKDMEPNIKQIGDIKQRYTHGKSVWKAGPEGGKTFSIFRPELSATKVRMEG